MNNIELVIFDMDGLLFDTESTGFRSFHQAMKESGFEFSIEIYRQMIGASPKESEAILQGIYGANFPFEKVMQKSDENFNKILKNEGIRVMPGVHQLLGLLADNNKKQCIASSSSIKTIRQYLSMTGLTEQFDFYISGDEVENGKPHPDIFLEACKRANVKTDNAIVLEDSYNGLKAAYSAGIRCILVPDLIEPTDEMKGMSHQVIPSLLEIGI